MKPDNGLSPIMEVVGKIKDPENTLSTEEKNKVKNLTGDVGNAVKASLIQLLMGQFSKIDKYDAAIKTVMTELGRKIPLMDSDELVALLSVLTKTSTNESKNVMEVFKKQGDDFKTLISELQKMSKDGDVINAEDIDENSIRAKPIIDLSPEKKDKVLRLVQKLSKKNEND